MRGGHAGAASTGDDMTDTGPTNPGEIFVVGQRRRPDGTFPPAPGGGGPGGGSSGGEHQNQVEDPGTQPYVPPPHPCDNPEAALEFNADAGAAEGLRRFQADANDPLLDSRERSVVVARNPVTGQIYLGNMRVGEPFAGEVPFDMTGIDPAHIIALMHSHAGSGPYPSGPDRTVLFPYWVEQIALAGGDPSLLRLYMVGTRADPGEAARLQIRVYNQTNLDGDEANPGDEVNPDAQYCPG